MIAMLHAISALSCPQSSLGTKHNEFTLLIPQVLVRRELEEAAKVLGERIRTNDATCEVSSHIYLNFPDLQEAKTFTALLCMSLRPQMQPPLG